MKNRISEFVVGLIFGLGLIVSGMTDPGKVLGFLDLAGLWDPSLAFVMGGAIAVGVFAFAVAKKRTTSFLGGAMHLPTSGRRKPHLWRGLGYRRVLPRASHCFGGCGPAQSHRVCDRHAGGHVVV